MTPNLSLLSLKLLETTLWVTLVICFDKMKSEAWRLTALWKNKHKEAHLFKKLWKLQTLVKKLKTIQILRKDSPTHPFTFLKAELREAAAENWDNPLQE